MKERERERGRERMIYLLATDSVIPVQTCVRPVCRLAVRRALMLWYVLMLDIS